MKSKKRSKAVVKPKKLTPKSVTSVQIGEVVLCKMRGFCSWPAMVTDLKGKLVAVKFFGDNTTHKSALKHIFKFAESSEIILENLKGRKNPMYEKSIREAEAVLGITSENSIINQVNLKFHSLL